MSETDLISRQAALHYIANWQYGEAKVGNETVYDTIEKCYKMIEQLPSVQPQRWIPVTERTPEPDERVAVTTGGYEYHVWDCMSNRGDDYFWEDEEGYYHNKYAVVAWMPLPEPYTSGADMRGTE